MGRLHAWVTQCFVARRWRKNSTATTCATSAPDATRVSSNACADGGGGGGGGSGGEDGGDNGSGGGARWCWKTGERGMKMDVRVKRQGWWTDCWILHYRFFHCDIIFIG